MDYAIFRMWTTTRDKLLAVKAITGDDMVKMVDALVDAKIKEMGAEEIVAKMLAIKEETGKITGGNI